jgi:hypothetical protein
VPRAACSAVYAFFRRWRTQGLIGEFHDRLRARVREAEGRTAQPTAVIVDPQSLLAAATVGAHSRGYDAGKIDASLTTGEKISSEPTRSFWHPRVPAAQRAALPTPSTVADSCTLRTGLVVFDAFI